MAANLFDERTLKKYLKKLEDDLAAKSFNPEFKEMQDKTVKEIRPFLAKQQTIDEIYQNKELFYKLRIFFENTSIQLTKALDKLPEESDILSKATSHLIEINNLIEKIDDVIKELIKFQPSIILEFDDQQISSSGLNHTDLMDSVKASDKTTLLQYTQRSDELQKTFGDKEGSFALFKKLSEDKAVIAEYDAFLHSAAGKYIQSKLLESKLGSSISIQEARAGKDREDRLTTNLTSEEQSQLNVYFGLGGKSLSKLDVLIIFMSDSQYQSLKSTLQKSLTKDDTKSPPSIGQV